MDGVPPVSSVFIITLRDRARGVASRYVSEGMPTRGLTFSRLSHIVRAFAVIMAFLSRISNA